MRAERPREARVAPPNRGGRHPQTPKLLIFQKKCAEARSSAPRTTMADESGQGDPTAPKRPSP